jgi:hypothetical protein
MKRLRNPCLEVLEQPILKHIMLVASAAFFLLERQKVGWAYNELIKYLDTPSPYGDYN